VIAAALPKVTEGGTAGAVRRLAMTVSGAVQGVGFRPFVFRLAEELGLRGWVINDGRGVLLEVEGPAEAVASFRQRLPREVPPRAVVHGIEASELAPVGFTEFRIRHSEHGGAPTAAVLPDVATCPECLAEVLDPADRRHRYPFTNCTNCGPRFTILRELPYDRPATTMAGFEMCPRCRQEYEDPRNRRFHAQPNACPRCGPRLTLADPRGALLAREDEALRGAARALGEGMIVAVKGLGGFHLMVDAGNEAAVAELRLRKRREEKPFALMVRDLDMARDLCEVEPAAAALLASPEAPIVLLPRRPGAPAATPAAALVAPGVAPGNPRLGLMLPPTPLHHLLLGELGFPVVATSGNLSDEPIAIDDGEALERLGQTAHLFLLHDRPIARHADDSVVFLLGGEGRLLRRARGHAPLPLLLGAEVPTLLAVGGQLKNAVGLSVGRQVFLSQHIGDLDAVEARRAFEGVIDDFLHLYRARPTAIVCDLHPDYASTLWAEEAAGGRAGVGREVLAGLPLIRVQHHHAHLAACLAEHGREDETTLGITWDGTGHGPDGTVWGGEFLLGNAAGYRRLARLRPFLLPGGEAAVREPRRCALALLWDLLGAEALTREDLAPVAAFAPAERRLLGRMLARGVQAPATSSVGRLFDAVASLLDLCQVSRFEGQAAMELEWAADPAEAGAWPLPLVAPEPPVPGMPAEARPDFELDGRPLLRGLLADLGRGLPRGTLAARFHNSLVGAAVEVARLSGVGTVALSGGCFLNLRLTKALRAALGQEGFEVLLHRRVSPGDGGLALGQIAVAAAGAAAPPDPDPPLPEGV